MRLRVPSSQRPSSDDSTPQAFGFLSRPPYLDTFAFYLSRTVTQCGRPKLATEYQTLPNELEVAVFILWGKFQGDNDDLNPCVFLAIKLGPRFARALADRAEDAYGVGILPSWEGYMGGCASLSMRFGSCLLNLRCVYFSDSSYRHLDLSSFCFGKGKYFSYCVTVFWVRFVQVRFPAPRNVIGDRLHEQHSHLSDKRPLACRQGRTKSVFATP